MIMPGDGQVALHRRRGRRRRQSGTSRIALFLGAGASAPYDMPTTDKLREKLGQDFPRPDLIEDKQFIDAEQILQALDDEIDFAKTMAGAHHCKIDSKFDARIKNSRLARDKVDDLVRSSYVWSTSTGSTAVEILGGLFELVKTSNGDVTVFTTNYDVAIEKYCEHASLATECIDGFGPCIKSKDFVWTGDFTPSDKSARTRVFLYKLHGSMNWQRRIVDNTREIIRKPDDSPPMDKSNDVYIRPTLSIKDRDVKEEPFATLRGKFDKLPELFDVCIAIGCSFRDKYIYDGFIEFIKNGKTLIAVGPKAATEFCIAVGKDPDSDTISSWEKMQLCSMAYRPGEADRFYAVHKKLGEDSTESVINAIKPMLERSASPNRIGFIGKPNV